MDAASERCHVHPVDWKRLGKRIKQVTRISGKSQGEIVAEIGRSRSAIGQWQRGEEHPTTSNLEAFAMAAGAELWIDFLHPDEERATFAASKDAIAAARAIDEMSDDELRALALRFVQMAPELDDVLRGTLTKMLDGLEGRRRRRSSREAG